MARPLTKPSMTGWGTIRMNLPHFRRPNPDLKNAHQDDGGEKIFNAMLGHQGHHDNGECACRTGDHAGAAADAGRDQTHEKRRVKAHQRVHACDKRKGNGFGYQSQRDGEAGQQFRLMRAASSFVDFTGARASARAVKTGSSHF